jgi:pyruvate dehydrogenase E1 component beta subunit
LAVSTKATPFTSLLASVMKTNRCVTVEEGFPVGAIGDHLASTIIQRAFDYLDAPPTRVCQEDVPMPYAANLELLSLPSVEKIVQAVKAVCYR